MKDKTWDLKKKYFKEFIKRKFYPNTYLVRSIFSNDYSNIIVKKKKIKILDIGTLYLNNLVPFKDRSHKLYATELTKSGVEVSKSIAKKEKIKCIIRQGSNTHLPFQNSFFDVIISLNTLHYEQDIKKINLALIEFKRVLKNRGILFIETAAPRHDFYKKCIKVKDNSYKLKDAKDIRNNQIFTFFKNKKQIYRLMKKHFSSVEVGEVLEYYEKKDLNFFEIKCKK